MEIGYIILLAVVVVIAVLFIAWTIYKKGLRQVIIDLIVLAERQFGSGEGRAKFNAVVNGVLVKLPIPFNMIPAKFIEALVQKIFDEIKEALDYTPTLKEE